MIWIWMFHNFRVNYLIQAHVSLFLRFFIFNFAQKTNTEGKNEQ